MSLSLPSRVPRWLYSRPYLLAATLSWLNIHQRYRLLLPAAVALALLTAGLLTLPVAGRALEIAADYPLSLFVLMAVGSAISTIHRRARLHASLVDSWLAPLGAPASLTLRVLLVPGLQLAVLLLAVTIALLAGSLSLSGAVTLWSLEGAAYVAGFLISALSLYDSTLVRKDFHYVEVREPRANWAQAPQLQPLSFWAKGQARVFAKPKVTARVLLFVLMAITLGTPGQQVIAIAAGVWVLLYSGALLLAPIVVAFRAARWLAPTTAGYARFTAALAQRVLLAQLWTWGWVVLLAYALAWPVLLRWTVTLAVVFVVLFCVGVATASWLALRVARVRLP